MQCGICEIVQMSWNKTIRNRSGRNMASPGDNHGLIYIHIYSPGDNGQRTYPFSKVNGLFPVRSCCCHKTLHFL